MDKIEATQEESLQIEDGDVLSRLEAFVGKEEETEDNSEQQDEEQSQKQEQQGATEEESAQDGKPAEEVILEVPVIVSGKEEVKQVSLSEVGKILSENEELRARASDTAGIEQKAMAAAIEQVRPIAERYEKNIQVFQRAVWGLAHKELGNVDMQKLAQEDPAEYVRLNARAQEFNTILQAAQNELQKLEYEQNQKGQQEYQQQVRKSVDTLKRDVPGWGDELYTTIRRTGIDAYGFTQEEVNGVVDPRMIKVLVDAHKYRELQAAKPAIAKKVIAAPKLIKSTRTDGSDNQSQEAVALKARFKKSGNLRDGARLLEKFL